MPHLNMEYSRDIAPDDVIARTLHSLHATAASSGVMDPIDIKIRAMAFDHYLIAGAPAPFVHLTVRLLEGRSPETKLMLSKALQATLIEAFPSIERLSVEMQDMDGFSYKKRPYWAAAAD